MRRIVDSVTGIYIGIYINIYIVAYIGIYTGNILIISYFLISNFKILLSYINKIGINPIILLLSKSFRSIGCLLINRFILLLLLLDYRKPIL